MKKIFHTLLLAFLFSAIAQAAPSVSVVFVLDESGSVSTSNFNLETQGFQQALNSLSLDGSIEVSVVGFSSSVTTIVNKSVLTAATLSSIDDALANNPKNSGGTYMSGAISTSTSILLGSTAPTKVICLATDGEPNSQYNTTAAADSAKASGITLTPVGIGLYSSGESYLNSIASNPPIANPDNFTDFATVVTNVCVGVTASALNIDITPEVVDFGVSATGDTQCSLNETVTVENLSTNTAQITGISIEGEDASAFNISSALGQDFDTLSFPLTLPAKYVDTLEIDLMPLTTPDDDNYDASLVITAEDSEGVSADFSALLSAPNGANCLSSSVIDAGAVITEIDEFGTPYTSDGLSLSETDVYSAIQQSTNKRSGLVTDGNARLFITANTSVVGGVMRFEIESTTQTESKLGSLDYTTNDQGDTIIDIPLDNGQATAVLRAGERFLGASGEKSISYNVKICLLDDTDQCSSIETTETIRERRAPVVLIHGLWASNKSWTNDGWFSDTGMKPSLEGAHFRVGMFEYTNSEGPSSEMQANEKGLWDKIHLQCRAENIEGYACTRNDLVGHSMGGLVSRKYVKDNQSYKHSHNFQQGSVRRLVTLGTPHFGSGFASLLTLHNTEINQCIDDRDAVIDLIAVLMAAGKDYGSALTDLSINSDFLQKLNAVTQEVNTFGVIGDTGTNLVSWDAATTRTGCTHSDLFDGNNSDSVVSVVSAQGNLTTENTATVDAQHTGMGTNDDIVEKTIEVLNGPLSDLSPSAMLIEKQSDTQLLATPFKAQSEQLNAKQEPSFASKIGDFLLAMIGISSAHAQDMPAVDLAVNSNEVSPNSTITFTASITGNNIASVVLTDAGTYLVSDNSAPYQWEIPVGNSASGSRTFKVVAIIDDLVVESSPQTVTVKPDLTTLQSLTFEPGDTLYLFPGSTYQLRVIGLLSSGFESDLTQSSMESVYSENIVNGLTSSEGDSTSIDVSADGMVTALLPGTAEVVVTNNGLTATQRITVIPVYDNDADGDGLTDTEETNLGLNPYNSDSDGNGVTDFIEVGNSADDPIDSDGDGVIDALDLDSSVVQTEDDNFVSIKTSSGTLSSVYFQSLSDMEERPDDLSTIDMVLGLIGFTVEDLAEGESITVTLTFDSLPRGIDSYLKYGPQLPDDTTIGWYRFNDFEIDGNVITLNLTDNEAGDSNLAAGVISDPGGPGNDPAIVTVESEDDSFSTSEDTALTLDVLANDYHDGSSIAVLSYTQPAHGTLSIESGSLVYTPATNYFGDDNFTYIAAADDAESEPATVSLTVTPVNDAPQITITGTLSTSEFDATTLSVDVIDVDSNSFTYQWNEVTTAVLSLTDTGSETVAITTPFVDTQTNVEISVVVSDGEDSTVTTAELIILNDNDAPTASLSAPSSVDEGDDATVTANVADAEGHDLVVSWAQLSGPDLTLSTTDSTLSFTAPEVSGNQTIVIEITVSDPELTTVETVSITIRDTDVATGGKKGGSFGWLIMLLVPFVLLRRYAKR